MGLLCFSTLEFFLDLFMTKDRHQEVQTLELPPASTFDIFKLAEVDLLWNFLRATSLVPNNSARQRSAHIDDWEQKHLCQF